MRILLPLLLLSAAACTQTAQDVERQAAVDAGARADLDRELAGLVPVRTTGCVSQTELRDFKAYGDAIVYRTNGSAKIVTRTGSGCGQLAIDGILITRTPQPQVCRGDIMTFVDRSSGFPAGTCSFGDFVRYQRAPKG